MNTPEIQARIERLNREHPPAKGMEWRAMSVGEGSNGMVVQFDGLGSYFFLQHTDDWVVTGQWYGRYFRQVPAEAKEEEFEAVAKEAKEHALAWNDSTTKDADRLRYAYCAGFYKARSTLPAPAPGLDYERLLDEIIDFCEGFACRNKPADDLIRALAIHIHKFRQSREPKPEPDVEPDEETPAGTPIEFGTRRVPGIFLRMYEKRDTRGPFHVADMKGDTHFVFICRLRREGK